MRDETVIIRKAPASYAYLFWVSGMRRGEHAALEPEGTTVGRDAECDIILDDDTVSFEQARLRKEEGQWYLYDLASANTTAVAGAGSIYRHAVQDKERITFGSTEMVFRKLT